MDLKVKLYNRREELLENHPKSDNNSKNLPHQGLFQVSKNKGKNWLTLEIKLGELILAILTKEAILLPNHHAL